MFHQNLRWPLAPHHRMRLLAILAIAAAVMLCLVGRSFAATAAPTSPANSIGAQILTMSGELINAGGTGAGAASYMCAAICFLFGGWALWQSRQPQNREAGHMGKALAGLALCGLFATMGTWVNKAAVTTSGGNATVNDATAMIQFGTNG